MANMTAVEAKVVAQAARDAKAFSGLPTAAQARAYLLSAVNYGLDEAVITLESTYGLGPVVLTRAKLFKSSLEADGYVVTISTRPGQGPRDDGGEEGIIYVTVRWGDAT